MFGGGAIEFNSFRDRFPGILSAVKKTKQTAWGFTFSPGAVTGGGYYYFTDYTLVAGVTWEQIFKFFKNLGNGRELRINENGELKIITNEKKEINTGIQFPIDQIDQTQMRQKIVEDWIKKENEALQDPNSKYNSPEIYFY